MLAGSAGAQRRLNVLLKGFDYTTMLDTLAAWTDISATRAETYGAARRALDEMYLPIVTADSANGLLFNAAFVTRRKIAGHPMSWALRCGEGMTGNYADSWKITIAYALFVDEGREGRTRLGIAVIAGAENVEGAYKQPNACYSTGNLEQEIVKRMKLLALNPLRRIQ